MHHLESGNGMLLPPGVPVNSRPLPRHRAWSYGPLTAFFSAGRFWHKGCTPGGKQSEVWKDSCGCRYCLGCHTVQVGEFCGTDLGEDA